MVEKKIDEFEQLCKKSFHFLEKDFDFRIATIERNRYGTYLTYANVTTAVEISLELMEGGVRIRLSRLVNGRVPPYPITIKPTDILHGFDLDDLIHLRAPVKKVKQPLEQLFPPGGPDLHLLKKILEEYADVVANYAEDILKGNFRVFGRLSKIVKGRSQSFGSTTKIWRFPKLRK